LLTRSAINLAIGNNKASGLCQRLIWDNALSGIGVTVGRRKINLSGVFAGQNVGVRQIADHIWLISFMHYDLGFFDDETSRVECAPNPFSAKVSTMCPV
jgi:hypothetical protein